VREGERQRERERREIEREIVRHKRRKALQSMLIKMSYAIIRPRWSV
jgi:hypothetical protein